MRAAALLATISLALWNLTLSRAAPPLLDPRDQASLDAHLAHQESPGDGGSSALSQSQGGSRQSINIGGISAAPAPASAPVPTPLMMGYFPDWTAFQPEQVDFARFDWVDFAFAVPASPTSLAWDDPIHAPGLLLRLVAAAHVAGKKAKLSVGGWSGSKHFSAILAADATRAEFVAAVARVYAAYGVDGVEFDWEYPGEAGNSGNGVRPGDSADFLAFLQLLRASLPAGAVITAATQSTPFAGADGSPMGDVSAFAAVLDWILVMNYDVWGSSPTPGPNAPLYDRCHNSTQPAASALAAYTQWTAAGFPAAQMVLGVPAYGYISKSAATHLVQRRSAQPKPSRPTVNFRNGDGDKPLVYAAEVAAQGSVVDVVVADGEGDDGGQIMFGELVVQGALVRQDPPPPQSDTQPQPVEYTSGPGVTRLWDECSSTPFLVSASPNTTGATPSTSQVITYDDPQSLWMKAAFARRVGMLGVNMFDVHGDSAEWDLVDAVRMGMGLPAVVEAPGAAA